MSVVDMVFDAIFATSGREHKSTSVPTAALPEEATMVERANLQMLDAVQGEQSLIALLQDPEACRRELARSPGFQDWLQMVFNAALRTHDIKVLHQIHICVGVFEKLICWYKEALPLLASALAMNEPYPYTPEVRRERAEMAFRIIFNLGDLLCFCLRLRKSLVRRRCFGTRLRNGAITWLKNVITDLLQNFVNEYEQDQLEDCLSEIADSLVDVYNVDKAKWLADDVSRGCIEIDTTNKTSILSQFILSGTVQFKPKPSAFFRLFILSSKHHIFAPPAFKAAAEDSPERPKPKIT